MEQPKLQWQGHDVKTISPTKSLPGTILNFGLSTDFSACMNTSDLTCALLVDAPALGLSNLRLEVRNSCQLVNSTLRCTTMPFTLHTANSSIEVRYYAQVGANRIPWQTTSIPILLDTTQPNVTGIETGYCLNSTCYLGSGVPTPVTVHLSDSVTAFEYKLVFLGSGGAASATVMDTCTNTECKGTVIVPCQDKQQISLQLTSLGGISSREDAQNDVRPFEQRVICATKAPQILSFTQTAANGVADQITNGGSLTFTATVRGTIGVPKGTLNVSGILGANASVQPPLLEASCAQNGSSDLYTCTWLLSPLNPGLFDLTFRVADPLGNYATKEVKALRVLELRAPPGNRSLDFFSLTAGKVNPERLNRMALDLAAANHMPYPTYLPYTLQRKSGNARILRQELTSCVYKLPAANNYTPEYNLFALGLIAGSRPESHVLYPSEDWNKPNRLDLQVRASRDTLKLSDTFNVRCTVDLTVTDGIVLYNVPEHENVSFNIQLRESPLGQPGQTFVKKIDHTQKKLEGSTWKTIRKLEKWRQQADQICRGFEAVGQAHTALVTVQGIAAGFCSSGWFAPIGEALNTFAAPVDGAVGHGILRSLWQGLYSQGGESGTGIDMANIAAENAQNNAATGAGGVVRKICRQVNCRLLSDGSTGTGSKSGSGAQDITVSKGTGLGSYLANEGGKNVFSTDPEASVTGAIFNQCIGGVIYNLNKYGAIECGYLQCLKDQSYYGHSIAVCELGRSYQLCTQVVGEIGELPVVRIFRNFIENINHIIQNLPSVIWKYYHLQYCAHYLGPAAAPSRETCPDWYMVYCQVEDAFLNTFDLSSMTKQAAGGLRNPAAAKRALEICDAALKNQTRPAQDSGTWGIVDKATLDYGAFLRNAKGQSSEQESANTLRQLDSAVARAGGTQQTTYTVDPAATPDTHYPITNKDGATVGYYTYTPPKSGSVAGVDYSTQGTITVYKTTTKNGEEGKPDKISVVVVGKDSTATLTDENRAALARRGITFTSDAQYQSFIRQNDAYISATNAQIADLRTQRANEQDPVKQKALDDQIAKLEKENKNRAQFGSGEDAAEQRSALLNSVIASQSAYEQAQSDYNACSKSSTCTDLDVKKAALEDARKARDADAQALKDLGVDAGTFDPAKYTAAQNAYAAASTALETARTNDANAQAAYQACQDNNPGNCARQSAYTAQTKRELEEAERNEQQAKADLDSQIKVKDKATLDRENQNAANNAKFANAVGTLASYYFKSLYDNGKLDWMKTATWSDDIPVFGKIVDLSAKWADFESFKTNLCNDLVYDIKDNDEGAIYQPSTIGTAQVVGTFGSETRPIENNSMNLTMYLTIVYVNNPRGSGQSFTFDIILSDRQSCATRSCPDSVSLTNNVSFNLTEGTAFSNGNFARTRIDYLPGKYKTICLRFNKEFPSAQFGKKTYCREIKEDTFSTGSPVPPSAPVDPTTPAAPTTPANPTGGWT